MFLLDRITNKNKIYHGLKSVHYLQHITLYDGQLDVSDLKHVCSE